MLQIIQDLKNGNTILEDVPSPLVRKGFVLIKTHCSLVSLGTEKMLVEFGRGSLISKARQQPDRVKQVLDKIKTEGLLPTMEAIFNKLGEPLPLGYCNAGEVIAVGEGVTEFSIGDRVASNGAHAQIVCLPKNLVAKIPDNVSYEEGCFTVIGSIGLQGIRLANPTLGETVVVIGLGLIGLITSQLLVANGCNVVGFDFDDAKVALARQSGVDAFNAANVDVVKTVEGLTNGIVGLDIQRADFFKKELSFQVSCSYGPGRYDEEYEHRGIDYPIGYVRWTEKRNFEAILNSISKKQLNVKPLITEKVELKDYLNIYGKMGGASIASILVYPQTTESFSPTLIVTPRSYEPSKAVIGIVGSGNFAKMTLLPSLKNSGAFFKFISSASGLTAKSLAKRYGFEFSTTNYKEILEDDEVDLVLIATRHNLHASMVAETLLAGKNVFVEKPLALKEAELQNIIDIYNSLTVQASINVGFNRRFSPFIEKARKLIGDTSTPINIIATMNSGFIPPENWVHDVNIGGGRIIGEACHYIDLMIFLTGSMVSEVVMNALGNNPTDNTDNAIITLKFVNGSQGVINYFSNGNKAYSKERIEVYSQGRTLIIDNFRKMTGYGFKRFSSISSSINKGHRAQFKQLIQQIKKGSGPLIPFEELVNTTKASLAALKSLKTGSWIKVDVNL
jgi:predicted dehydrogenase/threonine dehydrogenase-like Zn-dependent dehydrogenase